MELITKCKEKLIAMNLSKKQMGLIAGCATLAVCGGVYGAVTLMNSNNNNDARAVAGVTTMGTSAYMEEVVSTGDIVVGISETGTASMYQEEVSYDFSVEVEEYYVKAGEDVEEGQAIALLNMDTVNELKDALELEIADAVVALADAEADYDLKEIQAEETLSKTIYYGENADYLYSVALTEIDEKLEDFQDAVDSAGVTLYYAYVAQEEGPDTSKLATSEKSAVESAETALQTLKDSMSTGTGDYEYCYLLNGKYYFCSADTYKNGRAVTTTIEEESEVGTGKFDEDGNEIMTTEMVAQTVTSNVSYDENNIQYSSYTKTSTVLSNLQTAYDTAVSTCETAYQADYDDAQDVLDAAVSAAKSNYSNANDSYASYENEMEYYQVEAYADYQTNLSNYAAAYDVYDNTLAMNANAVETAEQALETLQTEYEAYDELPEDGIVLATCSGYIMRLAEEGSEYSAGYTLAVIGSDQSVEIWVSISQDDIADISIGMETNVIFDAYEEYSIPAVVESISTSSSTGMTSTVNYTLEISCDISAYPELVVFDSMSATVTFVQRQESGVIMVSSKCITTEDGVSYVKMLDDSGELMMVEVETGFSDGFDVEIISGVEVGDVVIIESAVG